MRTCKDCGQAFPLTEGFEAVTGKQGVWYRRTCRDCTRSKNRARYARMMTKPDVRERRLRTLAEAAKRRRKEDPEAVRTTERRRNAEYRDRIKADPQRRKEDRIKRRIDAHLRKEAHGLGLEGAKSQPARYEPYDPKNDPHLATGPLREFVQGFHDRQTNRNRLARFDATTNYEQTADLLEVEETYIRRLLAGDYQWVRLTIADRIFVKAGRPELLAILYPPGVNERRAA
jgi:hypothetical protein